MRELFFASAYRSTSGQSQAPIIVTKMKNAGVTTVIMVSDIAMNKAMMAQATKQ